MEFHISRKARDQYQFDQSLFSLRGNVVFANFRAARLFTQKLNQNRDLVNYPERGVKAGQINAMGMIDEILHYVIGLYRQQSNSQVFQGAAAYLDRSLGKEKIDQALRIFTDEFPPLAVYRREVSIDEYLTGETDGIPNREATLEEMLMLWLANSNPAMAVYSDLFDDQRLERETIYPLIIANLQQFFETQPHFGPDRQNLVDMLHSPAVAVPYSLTGQLEYIREKWASLLGRFLYRLLGSLDLIREEEKAMLFGGGPGPVPVPKYIGSLMEAEPERFSPDKDWMPTLILMAKNAYVWLDQLSKKYHRNIYHLDHIPDEELDTLARWGISGLWLIGLWERSEASVTIKRHLGNLDAVASAYSLANYQIANDLGGDAAYQNLRDRAWQRGIRLASDMVPNHMGIDSEWVMNHPDWFIGLDYSPFPSYTFGGPDLSHDSRVGIFLEDHYYDRTDAAVVFRRLDRWSGSDKFIYHGNDGTSMPWNDTAQLDYLNPAVREAVIQTILHVARQFPVIRFDAAMTLAKKHYQRLWYPEPGTGGAIPSRSEHGITHQEFDNLMPVEFWREVVDRVAKEAPDTLLLAEAFWLMEGYFVRTLGMHRVYNSAFMNMLRNEENANYRLVMKNTLEFDPEILKRFVNFMNNPDERTAVDQFGKGDKYFGIATVMATMPGLPMFGHGQIEGFTEKYGMEFRKAIWEEAADLDLVHRHERDIFPLLHRRYLFAGVENFLLYDFFTGEGNVNEDVFAYSNGQGDERALVVYNNRYASTSGWIRTSAGYMSKSSGGETRGIVQKSLGEGLGLHGDDQHFIIFRDHGIGLEFIRSSKQILDQGLYFELNAYANHVLLDMHEVQDNDWGQYRDLNAYLNGRGVPSISDALRELLLRPIHYPFRQLVNPEILSQLIASRQAGLNPTPDSALLDEVEGYYRQLISGINQVTGDGQFETEIVNDLRAELDLVLHLSDIEERFPLPSNRRYKAALEYFQASLNNRPSGWIALYGWVLIHNLGKLAGSIGCEEQSRAWMDEWQLGQLMVEAALPIGLSEGDAWRAVQTIKILNSTQGWFGQISRKSPHQILEDWLKVADIQQFLGINRYQGVLWFNKESFDQFLAWMNCLAILQLAADPSKSSGEIIEKIILSYELIQQFKAAEEHSDFQIEKLLGSSGLAAAAKGQEPVKEV